MSSVTFVHYSGPSLPKGGDSRSVIRSQAMKLVHRQRREKALQKGIEPGSSTSPKKHTQTQELDNEDEKAKAQEIEDGDLYRISEKLYRLWCRWASSTVIQSVSITSSTKYGPSASPRLYTRMATMISYYLDYVSFNIPGVNVMGPLKRDWAYGRQIDETLAFACSVIYINHFDVLRENVGTDDYRFKAGALRRINQSLQTQTITDDIIAAILCLSSHENIRGRPEVALTHLRGIRQILNSPTMSRNLNRVANILEMVESQDLKTSLMNNCKPILTTINAPKLRGPRWLSHPSIILSSPLRLIEDQKVFEKCEVLGSEVTIAILDCFAAMELLFLQQREPSLDLKDRKERLHQRLQMLEADIHAPGVSLESRIAAVCRETAIIHLRATLFKIPHHHAVNRISMLEIYSIMHKTPLEEWFRCPFVALWIILTGGSAAWKQPQHPFFVCELLRFTSTFGFLWYQEWRNLAMNFMWLQAVLRKEWSPTDTAASSSTEASSPDSDTV